MKQTGLTPTSPTKGLGDNTLTFPVAMGTIGKWQTIALVVMGMCALLGSPVEALGPSPNSRDVEEPEGHATQGSMPSGEACTALGVNLTAVPGLINFTHLTLGNYSINDTVRCHWRLSTSLRRITFRFTSFNIGIRKPKSFCKNTKVTIDAGANCHFEFCGGKVPTTYRTCGGGVFNVHYQELITQAPTTSRFSIRYHATQRRSAVRGIPSLRTTSMSSDSQGCVGSQTIYLGEGESPLQLGLSGYDYHNHCNKKWHLTAPQSKAFRIQASGRIEGEAMCRYDRLSFYSVYTECFLGDADQDKACHRFGCLCGSIDTAYVHHSICNRLTIWFESDETVTESGFSITVTLVNKPNQTNLGPLPSISCGRSQVISSRVTGGCEASRYQFPWQASIEYRGNFICGGSVISDHWILTAAHCVSNVQAPELITVRLGKHYQNVVDTYEQTFQVAHVVIHCNYDPKTYDNDIALLQVNNQIQFNYAVLPICLTTTNIADYTECQISGWGSRTEDNNTLSNGLRYGDVSIENIDKCISSIGAINRGYQVTDNMVCAIFNKTGSRPINNVCSDRGRDDACKGDSGGPLILKVGHSEASSQVGIVSWGIGCGRAGLPGMYTRLQRYTEWIRKITQDRVYFHD